MNININKITFWEPFFTRKIVSEIAQSQCNTHSKSIQYWKLKHYIWLSKSPVVLALKFFFYNIKEGWQKKKFNMYRKMLILVEMLCSIYLWHVDRESLGESKNTLRNAFGAYWIKSNINIVVQFDHNHAWVAVTRNCVLLPIWPLQSTYVRITPNPDPKQLHLDKILSMTLIFFRLRNFISSKSGNL